MGPVEAAAESQMLVRPTGLVGQADWKWCRRCQGLFYADNGVDKKHCPGSRHHDPQGSGDYTLNFRPSRGALRAAGQSGWRWCLQCQGLFFADGGKGVCPAAKSGPHVFDKKLENYVVKRANPLADLSSPLSLLVVAPVQIALTLRLVTQNSQ
jgi:hypothetical protein